MVVTEEDVQQSKGQFESAGQALSKLSDDFNDWSSILTTRSIQAAYAIIAGNWAVHGSAQQIIANPYAKASIVVVFVFLAANLVATRLMIWMHYKQYMYAESDPERWEKEFSVCRTLRFWPYTKGIDCLGIALRWLKTVAPLLAAILFLISLFF